MESFFFKSLIEFVIVVLLFYDLFFWPRGMWDLGSLTGDCTCSCPLEGKVLTTGSPAAATAKSLQSCPTLCGPIAGSPPGSPIPGILQARTLEWVAISFSNAWKWKGKGKSLSCVRLFSTPWTAACQASLSFTTSQSLLKFMSIESVMSSNCLSLSLSSPG